MIVLPHSGHKFKFAKQLSVAKPEKITFLQKKDTQVSFKYLLR